MVLAPQTQFTLASRSSINDASTGVCARWYFELRLEEECSRALRNGRAITLVTLQVEAAKAREAARRLKASLRSYDLVGSLGGGQLVVAVMDSGKAERDQLVERLRGAVGAASDVGAACFPQDGITFEALLKRAEPSLATVALAA